MEGTFKSSDFLTVVGMMMTLVGIFLCLFFLFAPVTFGETLSDALVNTSPDFQLSMRWIQPIVGQAIVEDTLLKQQYGNEVGKVTSTDNWTQSQATERANAMKIDQAALVQWVIGRLIVELTSHRIESGLASDRLGDETNQRIMTIAQRAERQFNEILRAEWQTELEREMRAEPVRRT